MSKLSLDQIRNKNMVLNYYGRILLKTSVKYFDHILANVELNLNSTKIKMTKISQRLKQFKSVNILDFQFIYLTLQYYFLWEGHLRWFLKVILRWQKRIVLHQEHQFWNIMLAANWWPYNMTLQNLHSKECCNRVVYR